MSTQNYFSKLSKTVDKSKNTETPPAFMLPFMKMPLVLYRLGLGWVLGGRFMQVTHIGRQSGKTYRTVLAVLKFDRSSSEIMVVSPWKKSNWYRNIQVNSALEVETAGIRYVPTQRSLLPEEIAELLIEFRQKNPIFSRMVARIPGWKIDSTYEEFLELARTLHGVAFRPAL
jgi:deazaflavin-dependent oxidoreductase (nitroreductase family)